MKLREVYQVCLYVPDVMCFLKSEKHCEVYQVLYLLCIVVIGCEFHMDDTRISRSLCSCIYHFKCGGRVGAPVIHGTDSHPPKAIPYPFSHPEPVHISVGGDMAGLS